MRKGVLLKSIAIIASVGIAMSNFATVSYAACQHVWGEWEIEEEATCSEDGEMVRYCDECWDRQTKVIPATGIHKWTEWKADSYLCEDGKWTRYCTECYAEETKIRKGDGSHLWSDWAVWSEADCLNEGKEYRECYNCYTTEYRAIPADKTKHRYSDWSYTKQPSIFEKGLSSRECYTCGNVETREIPKLVAKVTLKTTKKVLRKGKSFVLKLNTWSNGDKISTYKINNKKVVTITSKGKVTAKKKGTAVITVVMKSGCTATCKIIVK